MNNKDQAWNHLATAQEYIQEAETMGFLECDNQIGETLWFTDDAGIDFQLPLIDQLENLAQAQKYIELATLALVDARRELQT